ncbi:MAG: hypothetical protein K9J37_05055 [Saprospiraceae bacterium]|nr:hypothetical protein [Saprospiraceae bacterium]MCF8249256.1 hypothetical protein [Saprospiraceae bacterium]MCF8281176.1 hypothetical protein [Bacteroidales bacterium]MCF8311467.1 hypothetical protein [Saprospiraceae bacterium]MCF8439875.1 hypothetical protein [Saprospiraceae bacterium]
MKKLRLLSVSFDTSIKPWELKKFRGAVAAKVGIENEWFHNHDNSEQFDSSTVGSRQSDPAKPRYHHRYPLIQYKIDTHQGQMRPMLLCLDDCIEEAHHFFSQSDWSLRIGDRTHDMRIARLHVDQINLNVWEQPLPYRLHKWRALSSDNFKEWQKMDGIVERIAFLENILAAHILSFARGVEWTLDKHFEVKITNLLKEEWVSFKDIKVLAFTIEFKANISMPDYIGLGQGSGEGFGVVRRQRGSHKLAVGSGQ